MGLAASITWLLQAANLNDPLLIRAHNQLFCFHVFFLAKPLELKIAKPFNNELGGTETDGVEEGDFQDPVDWLVDENRKEHRTDMYEQKNLIVRRAGVIKLKVTFTREFNSAGDTLRLEFSTGKAPAIQYGTMAIVDCKEDGKLDKLGWTGTLEVKDETIEVEVNVPPTAAIGKYSVKV